jgi:hypothetical protein
MGANQQCPQPLFAGGLTYDIPLMFVGTRSTTDVPAVLQTNPSNLPQIECLSLLRRVVASPSRVSQNEKGTVYDRDIYPSIHPTIHPSFYKGG